MTCSQPDKRISFARVAREANVSTWFVYNNPEVKDAIRDAMNEQTQRGEGSGRNDAAVGVSDLRSATVNEQFDSRDEGGVI